MIEFYKNEYPVIPNDKKAIIVIFAFSNDHYDAGMSNFYKIPLFRIKSNEFYTDQNDEYQLVKNALSKIYENSLQENTILYIPEHVPYELLHKAPKTKLLLNKFYSRAYKDNDLIAQTEPNLTDIYLSDICKNAIDLFQPKKINFIPKEINTTNSVTVNAQTNNYDITEN